MAKHFPFLFIVLLFLSVNGEEQIKSEDAMCGTIAPTLCVKTNLKEIAEAAKTIHDVATKIEYNIYQQDPHLVGLINNVKHKTITLSSTFPSSENHQQFLDMNNIDKSDLIHLIKEQYQAVRYLYKSVYNLRNSKSIFGDKMDDLFETIQVTLQEEMICNYRNIIGVFGENLLLMNKVTGIQVSESRRRKREITSLVYNTHAVIIARLARNWMKSIGYVLNNIENKLF